MNSKRRRLSWIISKFAIAVILGLVVGATAITKAQQPDPRQAMVKELSASGPHASLGDEARVFDRLVGTWDCDFGFYAEDGSITHAPGELKFGWIIDGRALQDIWITYPRKGSKERGIGTSIRFFESKSKMWEWCSRVPRTAPWLLCKAVLREIGSFFAAWMTKAPHCDGRSTISRLTRSSGGARSLATAERAGGSKKSIT